MRWGSNTGDTLHHLLHYLSEKSHLNFRWLCSELFSLAACILFLPKIYFLLPTEFLFCSDIFLFCREIFSFVKTYFFFWPREFLFCREFSFFCPDLFLFSCDTCGPPYCSLLSANFEILKIAVLKNFQTRMKVMEFFFSKVGG